MKNQDQNMEQVEARSTKRFASLGTALAVVFLALVVSSFTVLKRGEVNLAQTCFEYTGADKTASDEEEATDPGSYASATSSITCPLDVETLCGICFEVGDFELDESGKPLFYSAPNVPTSLGEVILANWDNPAMHGLSITADNGKTVKLLFRAKK
ncbi:hypothetical protein [Sphingobacterium faecale]|uniref:Uncharacterized protein n=1 Tax=Sphingobacterium faecale TaxID=2803775 RepID=A0ABS1R9W4_9SPHI|nr:hypothetical protein [Sphingobacterium faecale]MBL1411515.1 hypothetical protein [Sphingobacterium faecale]